MESKNRRIIWISGRPTSGKSWVGDFLQEQHGWFHLDGDEQHYLQPDSEANKLYAQADYIKGKGHPAPQELWAPFLTNIYKQALDVMSRISSDIVVTRGFHDKVQAEFVRCLFQHSKVSIKFVELRVSDEEFVLRYKKRISKQVDMHSLSTEEYWRSKKRFSVWGDFNEVNVTRFIKDCMIGWNDTLEGIDDCFIIENSEDHNNLVEKLTKILDLPQTVQVDQEKIEEVNDMRWKNYTTRR